MNRGYIHLWRKSLDAGWIRNHELWAFWSWCLLKATYRGYDAIVGLQRVHLKPGQFVFGLKKAAQETGLSIQQIRTIIDFLKKAGNLTIKTTNKFSIITIINWDTYQGGEPQINKQSNKPLTNEQQHTIKETYKKETPAEISAEILELKSRYSDQEIIDQVLESISSTRKTGKIADSVKLGILKSWERYPVEQVLTGLRTYLSKDYASEGKNEKYLAGIIRNQAPPPPTPTGPTMKRSGSPKLDAYYQSQGYTLI